MARSEDNTWDITESVGATAFGAAEWRAREAEHDRPLFADRYARLFLDAAEWRAREAEHDRPLFTDPYARLFLDAATARGWSSQFGDELFAQMQETTDPRFMRRLLATWSYLGSRTKWFDDFITASGVDVMQAVVLAAGLDARAWRLPWKPGSAIYEIDQPAVLAFKTETLRSHDAELACRYIPIGHDLRQDWPKALCNNGFDPHQPTAWLAEGLLPYLPATAQDLLLDRIRALSAKGSRIAVDALSASVFSPENRARLKAHFDRARAAVTQGGGEMPDTWDLWFDEQRTDVCDLLRKHGWQVEAVEVRDLMASYHRDVPAEDAGGIPHCVFISGQLS
jgi:methyltransferase (TIGR00027 family)